MSKNLRRMVQSLLEDAEKFLPKEFHPRLTEVSKEFFQARKKAAKSRDEANELRRSVDAIRQRAAELEATNGQMSRDMQELEQELKRTQENLNDFEALKEATSALSMLTVQMHAEQYDKINRLRYRLGRAFVDSHKVPPLCVKRSDDVVRAMSQGVLSEADVEAACMSAIGAFIDQDLESSNVMVHSSTSLLVQVTDKGNKDGLILKVSTVDECRNNARILSSGHSRRCTAPQVG